LINYWPYIGKVSQFTIKIQILSSRPVYFIFVHTICW